MPIFNNSGGKLSEISEISFNLEKDLQKLVEQNMKTIFGIDFVRTEFELNSLRIDSLGFDKESNAFVIIEYKRDKNFSVIDQGFAYLSLLLNNKAEFILAYNENSGNSLKKDDVDWSQSKVIFISPSFTSYQRQAIGFRDLPIELWEVKQFSNKIMLFNQIQSPEKSESITKISPKSELVRSVSREVRTYTEEFHLEKVDDDIKSIYKEIKNAILSIGDNVTIKPTAKYIAFLHKTNFADITILKSSLKLFLNMKKGSLNDPKKIARDVSTIGHWGNGDYELQIKESTDIGYLLSLIRQSYDKN
jgi:predicted transport protein